MHVPVLAGAALEYLRVRPEGIYVDCTAGAAGHSQAIAQRLTTGRLIALDRDPLAVALARLKLIQHPSATVVQANYGHLAQALSDLKIGSVDGVLLDAGVSSMQIDDPARGFSFQREGPLDMRMDTTEGMTAMEYLASVDHAELTRVLRDYGDLTAARRIAKCILDRRDAGTLQTTTDLSAAVRDALPFVSGEPDETRTVFQSIRIAVNDELRWIEKGMREAIDALTPGGRIVVITFHSGEDRIAKNVLRDESRPHREFAEDGRLKRELPPRLKLLTPKPLRPDEEEIERNPRSHSAKLRAAERALVEKE